MNARAGSHEIHMIPVDAITVLNPRERNGKVFDEIVANIKAIGLKKPITVTPRTGGGGADNYLLVCGEGRLKAFKVLGEPTIPALVIQASDEDAFIMSLAENIARRQCRPLELLASIEQLFERGYNVKAIADKTGFQTGYVQGILTLLQQGEERLLVAVQKGSIPLTAALTIVGAGDDDKAVQLALQEAYESGKLRGKQLMSVRKIIDRRRTLGRSVGRVGPQKAVDVSTSSLVRTYRKEVDKQKLIVKKATMTQQRLLFITGALRELMAEENFVNLLRAEGLDNMPKYIAERVWPKGGKS